MKDDLGTMNCFQKIRSVFTVLGLYNFELHIKQTSMGIYEVTEPYINCSTVAKRASLVLTYLATVPSCHCLVYIGMYVIEYPRY